MLPMTKWKASHNTATREDKPQLVVSLGDMGGLTASGDREVVE